MKKINLFCELSKKGFIVAEINDLITKEELVLDLKKASNVSVFDLNMLSKGERHLDKSTLEGDVLLIDEVATPDIEGIIVNLNYNRDWFLKLNKIVIFVLPTVTVNRLIEYSYSFWSFVYLHVVFDTKFPQIVKPHFIYEFLSYDNAKDLSAKGKINKNVFGTNRSASSILTNYCKNNDLSPDLNLNKMLLNMFSRIDFNSSDSVEGTFDSIFLLGKSLVRDEHFEEAIKCFEFLQKHFNIGEDREQIDLELKKNLIFANYKEGNYLAALDEISKVLNQISEETLKEGRFDFLTEYDIASYWNNAGVMLYLSGEPNEALSMFNTAANLINDAPITFHIGEVLFNLSLVSLYLGDHRNALYYIDNAVECLQRFSNRSISILQARYNVLKAYILVNIGAIHSAKKIIGPSLSFLRSEIYENHEYIMEAHFVFSLIYLHNLELEKAASCAQKASNIARRIGSPLRDRARIYQLLGEIFYYMGDYAQAQRYLYHASRHNYGFSDEVLEWMKSTKVECDTFIKSTKSESPLDRKS